MSAAVSRVVIATVIVGTGAVVRAEPIQTKSEASVIQQDAVEIKRAGTEMLEAWYGGDGEKMARVLHDDLAKRGVLTDPKSGATAIRYANKAQMVDGARSGVGKIPRDEWAIEATILDQGEKMATVKVVSAYLIDVCQVAKVEDQWLIVNVLWTTRGTPPWFKK
jgi:hypothetical protein